MLNPWHQTTQEQSVATSGMTMYNILVENTNLASRKKMLGHETMMSVVCLSTFLWICDMAGLLGGTFVSWWYLPRIWPSVTDMQYYYHARYPTDDWHLAYMFSLVYFSVEVCLKGVFPHSVSTWRDSCIRVHAPLPLAFPVTKKQNRTGVTKLSTWTKRGGI